MILPLRQRHRRMFTVLGVLVPIVFVVGIATRKPMPLRTTPQMAADFRAAESLVWERGDIFSQVPVRVRLLHSPVYFAVEFLPGRGFAKPDLLVYWVTAKQSATDTLPDNATLLGAFNPSVSFQLPQDADRIGGAVVLYSLADHEIVDWSKSIPI